MVSGVPEGGMSKATPKRWSREAPQRPKKIGARNQRGRRNQHAAPVRCEHLPGRMERGKITRWRNLETGVLHRTRREAEARAAP